MEIKIKMRAEFCGSCHTGTCGVKAKDHKTILGNILRPCIKIKKNWDTAQWKRAYVAVQGIEFNPQGQKRKKNHNDIPLHIC